MSTAPRRLLEQRRDLPSGIQDRIEDGPGRRLDDVVVRGAGPGLVLAHGAGGGIEANFGLVLDDLATDHLVVGSHYPGAGTAPPRERLELDDLANDLVTSARRAGLRSAVVVGESMGCAVALRAATRHPDLVAGLVLTAGFARADPVLRAAADVVRALSAGEEPGRPGGPKDLRARARFLTVACLTDTELSGLDPATLEDLVAATATAAPPGTAAHFDLAARLDISHDLPRVRAPVMFFVNAADRLVLPTTQRHLARGLPDATVIELSDAGHVLSRHHRRTWLQHVRAFLRGDLVS